MDCLYYPNTVVGSFIRDITRVFTVAEMEESRLKYVIRVAK